MRTGRKRKSNVVRFPGGKVAREHPDVVRAVVIAQRRKEVPPDQAGDPLAGHTLGRLRLRWRAGTDQPPDAISEEQYVTGEWYGSLCVRHAALMGYATGSPRAAAFERLGAGVSCAAEPDEEVILKTRRLFGDCYRALMETGRLVRAGPRLGMLVYDVCLDRRHPDSLSTGEIGNLKLGLNALGRLRR
jgi:hypothetical protein